MIVPAIIAFVAVWGCVKKVDVYDSLITGAGDGLGTMVRIVPAMIALLTAVYMLRASGFLELAARWSPAGAAVTGALLGAAWGEEAIPEQWLEELECEGVLRELAGDLFGGCPMMKGSRIFDIEWDEKYNTTEY